MELNVLPLLLASVPVVELQVLASNECELEVQKGVEKSFASVKSTSCELADEKTFELTDILKIWLK